MKNTFGSFLKQKRQEKNLTQKELAKLLIISESAISKWEKDVAHPDITLLPKLSEILGVTEHELITASIDKNTRKEKSQARKWRALSFTWNLFFYIAYGLALIPCFICNLAIDGTLSWFWIVMSALLLTFTFTNLPKLIKKNKLLILPLFIYLALCLLLGVCCIYTNGNWYWIAVISILLGLLMIFVPIYIAKYKIFSKIKKYNDFVSVAIIFIILNILLIIIDNYTITNHSISSWYLSLGLPITLISYLSLSAIMSIRFIHINLLLKTSLILLATDLLCFVPPLFIRVNNSSIQKELDDLNILHADFSHWTVDHVDNNVFCIIFLTILSTSLVFLFAGIAKQIKQKNTYK